jgi:predicted Zn-dependent peptidase
MDKIKKVTPEKIQQLAQVWLKEEDFYELIVV